MKRFALLSLLGVLTALAPFVNNMFSPAMPDMMAAFATDKPTVQLGLTACMLGLALGQVIVGPLSDRMGRYRPLLWSMILMVAASQACAVAPSMTMFVILRLVQGLAAGGGIVIARSMAADISSGRQLIKALAFINIFSGLAPIATPMLGGALVSLAGWQGPLWAMMAVAAVLTLACAFVPESLPAERRTSQGVAQTFSLFGKVFRNRRCVFTIMHQGASLAVLFGNIAFTPFMVMRCGYSPQYIGYALAVNGVFTALGAGSAAAMVNAQRGIAITSAGLLLSTVAMVAVLLADGGLWLYEVAICVMLFFVGITLTSSSGHAMESARGEVGTASALLGAVGFVVGAVVAPLMGLGNMMVSAAIVYVVAALFTALFARVALKS